MISVSEDVDVPETGPSYASVGIQASVGQEHKCVQVKEDDMPPEPFSFSTDAELNTTTGIPTLALLDTFVEICEMIWPGDYWKFGLPLKYRILLTTLKLKQNLSNSFLANLFKISNKTAENYFADTIQLLAKVLASCIYWQSEKENRGSLPKCFAKFRNTMTVLDCTEIKTIKFGCIKCRTSIIKLLLGVSPSGLINFISLAATGNTSNKAIFNLTDLASKLKPGDAVIVGKGFMNSNDLQQLGVQLIRPQFVQPGETKEDVENNRQIASARVPVKMRIARIKTFKILSETVNYCDLPYLDDIVTVICAISNLSSPILSDDQFL